MAQTQKPPVSSVLAMGLDRPSPSLAEPPLARARATVDTGAIEANARFLRRALGSGAELCAVVKAEAYGHGAEAAAAAALRAGATRLAVATAAEGAALATRFDGVEVLVMGPLRGPELDLAIGAGAEVGLWSADFLPVLRDRAHAAGGVTGVHLKLDSGMGRFGCPDEEEVIGLARAVAADPNLLLAGVWTHFATADQRYEDGGYFEMQLDRFERLVAAIKVEFPATLVHAANSAAVIRERRSHFEMARCGIALYGLDPFQRDSRRLGLEPALTLSSFLAEARRFPRGKSTGYGRAWRAPEDTWLGLVPIGYGDGFRRALSGRAEVLIEGRRRPVVGRISMDSLTVDLGSELDVARGAEVILIGVQGEEEITAEEVAATLGTINYEVTTGLSSRVERRPLGAPARELANAREGRG
jgi:alanine racemase